VETGYLAKAIAEGHASLSSGRGKQRITYVSAGRTEIFDDPEEKVRSEYWAELIYRYGYDPARIGIEVTVPDRTPRDSADLVVYEDVRATRPYAVIECKQDAISDAEFAQAVEQAAGNGTWAKLRAAYVGVVAGSTRRFLDFSGEYGALEREQNIVADLPDRYGKPADFKYRKGADLDIAPVSKDELIAAIRKSHQTLWGGGRLSPPTAFGELCKLIFVKISDEQAARRKGAPYQFQIKTHESSRELGERIRNLYREEQKRDPDVFTETIKVSDGALRSIVSHLEGINLSKTDLDTKGLAFEQFMDSFFKGDFGQYFTPREVVEFIVAMVRPQESEIVLDPSCGSGGFLLHALEAVRADAGVYFEEGTEEHYRYWHRFAERNLYGIEINDEITRVAKMNMIIHDDGHSNIVGADALERIPQLRKENRGLRENAFDVILTNPPFGSQILVSERPYLVDYALATSIDAKGKSRPRKGQKSEILFLERIWQFLKPTTGRAGIILPDGMLTNSSLQYVRDFLVDRFQLLAVISLPSTAFTHFGAGVKASVVIVRKRGSDEGVDEGELVFMAAPENIGYDATGREAPNDLPAVIEAYRLFQDKPGKFLA
jgi:type I restriction enzyme M protein